MPELDACSQLRGLELTSCRKSCMSFIVQLVDWVMLFMLSASMPFVGPWVRWPMVHPLGQMAGVSDRLMLAPG